MVDPNWISQAEEDISEFLNQRHHIADDAASSLDTGLTITNIWFLKRYILASECLHGDNVGVTL